MKFQALITLMLISTSALAIDNNGPFIKNNSNTVINYVVNGGKTEKACSFIGIGSGKVVPQNQLTKIEYSNQEIVKFLCLIISSGEKDAQSSILAKVATEKQCIITINSPDKIITNEACLKGINNEP